MGMKEALISFLLFVSVCWKTRCWFPAVFLDHCSPRGALVLCGVGLGLCSACDMLKAHLFLLHLSIRCEAAINADV